MAAEPAYGDARPTGIDLLAERLADEGMAVMGYHLPFPGVGYVQRDGDAFRFVPETYQTLVDA